ncbi:MAG: hypothetical protein AB8B91_19130, partial [Rubripirellula sp.]
PPTESPVTAKPELPEIGWIVHTAPKDIVISDLQVHVRDDGKLAAIVRLIQTRPQPCKASLRFLHNVQAAFLSETSSDLNRELPKEKQANEEESRTDSNWLKTEGDSVKLSMPGHGVVDLIAIFE